MSPEMSYSSEIQVSLKPQSYKTVILSNVSHIMVTVKH